MYNNIQILVNGIVATGNKVFQASTAAQIVNEPDSQDIVPSDDEGHNSTDKVCY
jgi:hypothetical protein